MANQRSDRANQPSDAVESPIDSGRLSSVVCSADCRSAGRCDHQTTRVPEENQQTADGAAGQSPVKSAGRKLKNVYTFDGQHQRAMGAVGRALRSGKLVRPKWCRRCHREARLEAHHHLGYEPEHYLDVHWLCKGCHVVAHKPHLATRHGLWEIPDYAREAKRIMDQHQTLFSLPPEMKAVIDEIVKADGDE